MIKKPSQIKFFIPTSIANIDATAEPTLETLAGEDYFGNTIAAGGQAINAMDSHPGRPFQANTSGVATRWRIDAALEREIRTKFLMVDGHNLRDVYPLSLRQTIHGFHDTNSGFASSTEISANRDLSGFLGRTRPYVRLNGTSHSIRIAWDTPINVASGDFAIQIFIRPYSLTGTQYLHSQSDGTVTIGVYLKDDDLWIKISDIANTEDVMIASSICSVGDDVAITVNFDRSATATATIEVNNGGPVASSGVDISPANGTLSSGEDVYIGYNDAMSSGFFNGRIYWWRQWSRLITADEIADSFKGTLPSSGVSLELTDNGLDPSGGKWNGNGGNFNIATVTGIFMDTPTGDDRGFYLQEFDEVDARYFFTDFNKWGATARAVNALVGQVVMGQMYEFNGVKPDSGLSGDIDFPGILQQQSLAGIVQTEKAYGKRPAWSVDFQISTIKDFESLQEMMDIIEGSLFPFYVIFNYDDLDPVIWRVRSVGGIKWSYTFGPDQPMSPSISLVSDL